MFTCLHCLFFEWLKDLGCSIGYKTIYFFLQFSHLYCLHLIFPNVMNDTILPIRFFCLACFRLPPQFSHSIPSMVFLNMILSSSSIAKPFILTKYGIWLKSFKIYVAGASEPVVK